MSDRRQHSEHHNRKDIDGNRSYHHKKHKRKHDKKDIERDVKDHHATEESYDRMKDRYKTYDFKHGEGSVSATHSSSFHHNTNKYYSSNESKQSHESKQSNETDQTLSKHSPIVVLQFERFRRTLNKLFSQFIEDEKDLWNFVKKYELARKKKLEEEATAVGNNRLHKKETASSELDVPLVYDQVHNINIDLKVKDSEMIACLEYYDDNDRRCGMSQALYEEWKLLLRTYLDFKQKEKFATLMKIRETQQNLPVAQYKQEIIDTIKRERIVIIAGDTGCGKSTQIPQYLVEAGYERIACTQPRRIACISLSKRVAYETLSQYSDTVGYQIRFEKHRRVSTKIVFITEGLLLRQVSSDSFLSSYDVLILDEIHERHLHGDFLLGVVKCLLHSSNVEMKIILMSATINIDLFHSYFDKTAKIIKVPGRLYPIQLEYHPIVDLERSKSEKLDPGPYIRILTIIDKKYPRTERGDVLVFMSGISEISSVVRAAQDYNEKVGGWIILSLHSTLSLEEQDKVFHYAPEGHRKLIVSTNIAETSVTIDGIRFVIDSGKVKEMSYDLSLRMSTLQEMWISKANAEQRKGRAGRTGPGICYRLYSESQYASFPDYSTPEIRRVSIDSLLLNLVCMGLGNVRKFPFLEPPPVENIEQSVKSLAQHGAVDSSEKATSLGRFLSDLPVDIPLGKILVFGSMFHQIDTILSLTAVLSVQSPFTNRAFRDPDCESARKELESEHGDPLTVLNAYREWLEVKKDRVRSRAWCKRRGIEEQRFYEVTKLRSQFKQVLEDSGLVQSNLTAPDDSMSSRERALRHGEIKLLKALKRKQAEEAPKKRKMLKPDSTYEIDREEDGDEREGDSNMDMNEVDFRLKHDPKQVQDLLSVSTARTHKDLILLKIILASGLYPQVAIGDEYNTSETVKEPLFHVKDKGFVSLHPFSVFASRSELLTLKENEIIDPPPGVKLPRHAVLGTNHQLLVYMSLLETNKPYLVNPLRLSALPTLLLFSSTIHTNSDLTQLVFDSWIEVQTLEMYQNDIELCVRTGIRIRTAWTKLLDYQLRKETSRDVSLLESTLTTDLVSFMSPLSSATHLGYSLRRLLPADMKTIYRGMNSMDSEQEDKGSNPFLTDYQMIRDETLGGIQVTPYLVYDCLADGGSLVSFLCPGCNLDLQLTTLEKLQHLQRCAPESDSPEDVSTAAGSQFIQGDHKTSSSSSYFCDICNKTYPHFNSVAILKHRKSHSSSVMPS